MKFFWKLLGQKKREFLVIGSLEAALSGLEAFLHPILLKTIFDQAIIVANFRQFLILGLMYLLLGLFLNITGFFFGRWRKSFENRTILSTEEQLLGRTVQSDARIIQAQGSASYVSRIHNDVLEGLLPTMDMLITLAKTGLASSVFVAVLIYLSWKASLILLVLVPFLLIISNRIGQQLGSNTDAEREAEAKYLEVLARTVDAFHTLRGFRHLIPLTIRHNGQHLQSYLDIVLNNYTLRLKQRSWSDIIMNISDSTAMVIGAYFVLIGQMSFGGFLAFINSLWRAVNGVFSIINLLPELHRNQAVLERLSRLIEGQDSNYQTTSSQVASRGVSVQFEGKPPLPLPELELSPGRKLLIRGANGSGKSTLLHVLAGTLKPDTGQVSAPEERVVLTAPVLLPPLPVEILVPDQALRQRLDLEEVCQQLPTQLSSGQRQKVGLALLAATAAELYIVDEPLANLDVSAQQDAVELIFETTQGKTLIVVHHGDDFPIGAFDQVIEQHSHSQETTAPAPNSDVRGEQCVGAYEAVGS